MTVAELTSEAQELMHQLAEQQRTETREGFERVQSAYGWAYANGWKSGRNRLADLIDPEVAK